MGLLKNLYTRTNWVDNKTLVNAERLNNIERGISGLYNASLCASDFEPAEGIEIETTDAGKVKISASPAVKVITAEEETYDPGVIYFLLDSAGHVKKIIINGIETSLGNGLEL